MHGRSHRVVFLTAVLLALSIFVTPPGARAQNSYTITQLGHLPNSVNSHLGFGSTWGVALNNAGQVAGYDYGHFSGFTLPPRAFRWDAINGIVQISTGAQGAARGINEAGMICGFNGNHAALFDPLGGISLLPQPLDAVYSGGNDINNNNQVAGWSLAADNIYTGLVWDADGTMHDVGAFDSIVIGINDSGQAVGEFFDTDASAYMPFVWDPLNGARGLPILPGGTGGLARKINHNGVIVGHCTVNGVRRATTWINGTPTDTSGGLSDFAWTNINNAGQMVGSRGSVATNGTVRNILYYLDMADTEAIPGSYSVWDINDQGQIIGIVHSFDGIFNDRTVLLTPSDRILPYPHPASARSTKPKSRYDPVSKKWYIRAQAQYLGPNTTGPAYLVLDNAPENLLLPPLPEGSQRLLTVTQPPYGSPCIPVVASGQPLRRGASFVLDSGPYTIAELTRVVPLSFTVRMLIGAGRP